MRLNQLVKLSYFAKLLISSRIALHFVNRGDMMFCFASHTQLNQTRRTSQRVRGLRCRKFKCTSSWLWSFIESTLFYESNTTRANLIQNLLLKRRAKSIEQGIHSIRSWEIIGHQLTRIVTIFARTCRINERMSLVFRSCIAIESWV